MSLSKRHRYPFTLLSDRVCDKRGCTQRIKQRMVDQSDAETCYRHWQARRRAERREADARRPR